MMMMDDADFIFFLLLLLYGQISRRIYSSEQNVLRWLIKGKKGAGKQKIIEIIPFCLTKNFKENRALRLSGRKKNDHFCSARFSSIILYR